MISFLKQIFKKRRRGFELLEPYQAIYEFGYAKVPARKTYQSAGYDICSIKEYVIPPGGKVVIETGLTAYMEPDEVLSLYVRSGLAYDHNLTLQNGTGIIDADFYGNHIRVMLRNEGASAFLVKPGDRIAQGIFSRYLKIENDDKQAKQKRKAGFGSTGDAA